LISRGFEVLPTSESLLVSPVVEPVKNSWKVYLPEGKWCDLWTGKICHGPSTIKVNAPQDRIPVFQRYGSIVPLNLGNTLELCSPVGNSTEEIINVVLLVFSGETKRVEFFQGKGNPTTRISVQNDQSKDSVSITVEGLISAVDILVLGKEPHKVIIDGNLIADLEEGGTCETFFWTRMPDRKCVRIHLPENLGTVTAFLS